MTNYYTVDSVKSYYQQYKYTVQNENDNINIDSLNNDEFHIETIVSAFHVIHDLDI